MLSHQGQHQTNNDGDPRAGGAFRKDCLQCDSSGHLGCRRGSAGAIDPGKLRVSSVGGEGGLESLLLLLAVALSGLGADLLVVLLEGGEVLAGLWVWRRRGKRVSVGCRDGVLGC